MHTCLVEVERVPYAMKTSLKDGRDNYTRATRDPIHA